MTGGPSDRAADDDADDAAEGSVDPAAPPRLHRLVEASGAAPPRRVLFAPYMPANPYQRQLARAVGPFGHEVFALEALGVDRPSFAREFERLRPDILHLHWLHPYFARAGLLDSARRAWSFLRDVARARRSGVRLVWSAHNLVNHEDDHPLLDRLVTRRIARLADRIIAHGPSARARLLEQLGSQLADKLAVVPLGNTIGEYRDAIDRAAARTRLGLDADTFVVLFLGRIRPYKGVFELMDAFAAADLGADSLLLIAGKAFGDGPRVRLKRRCKQAARVRLDYGHVADDELQTYLRAADVTALPYRDILTSSAVVLNMSFASAIVAPRVGCIGDVLDEDGGFLYDPAEPHGLSRALEQARRNRSRLADMGLHNRRRIAQWPWPRIGAMVDALYRAAPGVTDDHAPPGDGRSSPSAGRSDPATGAERIDT